MWPHCCPPFKWLRGGNLEVEGREGIFDEKIHYSVLFCSLSPSFSLCHSLWERSIYYINGENRKKLSWRKTVVIVVQKVIQPPSFAKVK